jgi:hypothetical protein
MHAGRSKWPKIVDLAPADMEFHSSNKTMFSSKQPRLSAGTTPTLKLPCFTSRKIVRFILVHSPSSS